MAGFRSVGRIVLAFVLLWAITAHGTETPRKLSDVFSVRLINGGGGPWQWWRNDIYAREANGEEKYIGTTANHGVPYAVSNDGHSIVFVHWQLHAPTHSKLSSKIYRFRYGGEVRPLEGPGIVGGIGGRWPKPMPGNLLPVRLSNSRNVLFAVRADDYTLVPLPLLDGQPVHSCAFNGDAADCRSLIAGDADINAQTYWGFTPLYLAIARGHEDVALLLIESGATSNPGIYPALNLAVMLGRMTVVREMLKRGAAVNSADEFGYTPLHLAVYAGSRLVGGVGLFFPNVVTRRSIIDRNITTELVELLIRHGADPGMKNRRGRTPADEIDNFSPQGLAELLRR